MSACDTCPVPGHCCRSLILAGGSFAREAETTEQAETIMRGSADGTGAVLAAGPPMPFRPLFKRRDGIWVWWCPNLSAETGRCLDYDNRPFACQHYEPGSDPICVLHEAHQ